ncbi:MAG TPA: M13 family metallopeptidase [Vicinamibacterales bacterium]|nr:M13 family metallopeptidase [Vicinamibacterales bacterium]
MTPGAVHRVAIGLALAAGSALAAGQRAPSSGIDLATLSPAIRPQDDLYGHVNDRWLQATALPGDRVLYSAATELQDGVFADLHTIIEDAVAVERPRRGSPTQQIADLYRSLIDVERLRSLGVSPIRADLDRIFAITNPSGIAAEAGRMASTGRGGPFEASLAFNPATPSVPAIRLSQSGVMLPDREYYLEDRDVYVAARQDYVRYLARIFALVGRPAPHDDAAALVALETRLAGVQWTRADSRDPLRTSTPFTLRDLERQMPGFDWRAWAEPQGISRNATVVLAQPSFFEGFAGLIQSEPLEVWQLWLAARLLTSTAPFLHESFGAARFDFFGRLLTGQEEPIERWKRGVSLVNGYLGDALGRLYVERHFSAASRTRVERMVQQVRAAYRQALEASDWLAASTRREALRKLSTLTIKVGYPSRWRHYNGLVIRADDLVGNIERAKRFEAAYRSRSLDAREQRMAWLITPQTVNAYYGPSSHEIVVAAALLQPPYFDPAADDAVNYGAIGAVIGHEIGHALDDRGRRYDADGRLRDWWTPDDDAEYRRRAAALVAQFSGYRPLPDVAINGALTLGENLGDLSGLIIAHRAWQLSLEGRPSPVLDGLTGDQRFFIGWARIWREKQRDEYLRAFVLSNPHAPAPFRTNGTVTNVPAFYDAFGVTAGDALFRPPESRVRIW